MTNSRENNNQDGNQSDFSEKGKSGKLRNPFPGKLNVSGEEEMDDGYDSAYYYDSDDYDDLGEEYEDELSLIPFFISFIINITWSVGGMSFFCFLLVYNVFSHKNSRFGVNLNQSRDGFASISMSHVGEFEIESSSKNPAKYSTENVIISKDIEFGDDKIGKQKSNKNPAFFELSASHSTNPQQNVVLPGGTINRRALVRFTRISPVEGRRAVVAGSLRQTITAQALPVLTVRTVQDNANSVRNFAANNKNPVRGSIMSVTNVVGNQYTGCELLTLNGIDDPGHTLSMLDKDNTNRFEFSKSINPSQDDIDFVYHLNGVANGLHDFLTEPCLICTDPHSNESMIVSHLDFPVIYKLDSNDKFSKLLNKGTSPGYVTNINKATGNLELFCSVTPYSCNIDVFEKRLLFVKALYPESSYICKGVAKGELDHVDGEPYHKAFSQSGSAYRYGYTVYLPSSIHQMFTTLRPQFQKNNTNLFSHQKFAPSIEQRFSHKKLITYQIIEQMPDDVFKDLGFDKEGLKAAYGLAIEVSLSETQAEYRRTGLTSQEYYACGRVRTIANHIHTNLDALNESLRHFDRNDSYNRLSFQKVAINTARLFKQTKLVFQYSNGVKQLLQQDVTENIL